MRYADCTAQASTRPFIVSVTRETAGSLIQAVWLTVQRLQPCTNAEVKTALGEPRNTVYHALQDLVQQGRARQEGKQYWVIDAPGASGDE
jgi:hypothetical protein